jgi:Arc/MetJ-type ribon-helix-helix transcriptional regulator
MGKKIKKHDKMVTVRLPLPLYDKLAECATLGDYRSVSQYIRDLIGHSVAVVDAQMGCE